MNNSPKPSEIIIMAGGAVLFISSFLDWIDFGDFGGANGWDDGFFPIGALIAVFGLAMAVQVAVDRFTDVDMPEQVVGFTWPQIHLALAVFTALVTIAYLIQDKGGADLAIGFWLALLSSIALVVGAVMLRNETSGLTGTAGPPQSF